MKSIIILLTLVFGLTLLAGCSTRSEDDSTIPWSRPAPWEGGVPGMPGMGTPY